ncbi:MAG: YdbH domain-containing protein, partial [Desulfobacteraceae bacterium]|nr:YdbH domain-containing protein [Desulfobacteraceae bacterium]
GIDFDFNLSSKGQIEHSSEGIKSNFKIDVSDGNIKIPESKLAIKGLATSLELKDLLTLRSKPAQVLTIESIKVNDIIMDKAIIKYNIESMDSLLIESTKIKWCNGIISSEALRLPNKDNNYSITLYCDRLELTDILKQIGAFHAEGNGTMNGRIPVTYSNGEIVFDNGFLFSTPGQGGKIIIDKADKLTEGIPMDTPQFSELDLAKEALKNYDYEWAKLNLNTFEDTLFVNMQFDGKPSKKVLPFEYKKELGRFVRVDASNPGSHFQGIKLDINLKLPFNQVMKFGNKIKKVLN